MRQRWLLYEQGNIAAILLPPERFSVIECWLGELRAAAFRQVSPYGPADSDLDGRDSHYWHLLVCDRSSGTLLGAQRLSFSLWQPSPWASAHSYLEHCYPGLAKASATAGLAYLEVGRMFVCTGVRHNLQVLPALIRTSGLLARSTGHRFILGLMSYRWVGPDDHNEWAFLDRIRRPPFTVSLPLPPPRHPLSFPGKPSSEPIAPLISQPDLAAVAREISGRSGSAFQLPALIRIYNRLTRARIAGLSVARDFNQIVEVLMCSDLHDHNQGTEHPGLNIPHQKPWLERCPSYSHLEQEGPSPPPVKLIQDDFYH